MSIVVLWLAAIIIDLALLLGDRSVLVTIAACIVGSLLIAGAVIMGYTSIGFIRGIRMALLVWIATGAATIYLGITHSPIRVSVEATR